VAKEPLRTGHKFHEMTSCLCITSKLWLPGSISLLSAVISAISWELPCTILSE
jgi:hypothetical protein